MVKIINRFYSYPRRKIVPKFSHKPNYRKNDFHRRKKFVNHPKKFYIYEPRFFKPIIQRKIRRTNKPHINTTYSPHNTNSFLIQNYQRMQEDSKEERITPNSPEPRIENRQSINWTEVLDCLSPNPTE